MNVNIKTILALVFMTTLGVAFLGCSLSGEKGDSNPYQKIAFEDSVNSSEKLESNFHPMNMAEGESEHCFFISRVNL